MVIITHPGQAHRDDFISASLVLAQLGPATIFRRNPTPEELEDPECWVIDVGGQHDALKRNFDHHQHGGEGCALTQVLGHFGLLALARKVWPWVKVTESLDTQGPFQVAKSIGLPPDSLFSLMSPIEEQLLLAFGKEQEIPQGSLLSELMTTLGKGWLDYLSQVEGRLLELTNSHKLLMINGLLVIQVDISRENKPKFGLEVFIANLEKKLGTVAATITQDDRGPGWCLFRRNDHPSINLSGLDGKPGIIFAHKGGFVATTTADADPVRLLSSGILA